MLYAVYESRQRTRRLVKADIEAAKRSPRVKHVVPIVATRSRRRLGRCVAIVASNWWLANQARSRLAVEWT